MVADDSNTTPYAIVSVGLASQMALAVYGACEGMASSGAASILHSQNRSILGPTYFIMIMISTIFFSSFLVALIVATNIDATLDVSKSVSYFSACMMVGITSAVSGKVCACLGKRGFRILSEKPSFLPILIILFGMIEFVLIIVFSCALLMVYQP
ncbi:putative subunit of V-type ATP synthase [Ordospora colligata]|jgi:V-type H+-transporting ATPase proteolipid subunit|uniref:Putative subunit of V-type ATP synthase n=1 Tax=Ordospora colligata OC4 TaxID=1354746 RepID=A0A0B2UL94_9MICR|nr:putative subunit of V-type ATP synthase [Ordospora colligata OC4]KHN70074.1 putative subunit of V-type ATP synthase [Ordospora colligata OC4]TBU16456.1 putative subunit of V-type ATP synthase [Ordospora colligata]TBU16641.1 putative subunit of V-type ATP synthase [Ordospora colligata]TBU19214.1 putative subunit of V-type ATP synthase [Ordospora colligata]